MGTYSPLTIDTIDLLVSVAGHELYKQLWGQMYGFEEIDGYWPKGWKVKAKPGKASLRLHISPQKKREIALLELGTTKQKHRWFKLRLYPNNFHGKEFEIVQEAMETLLPGFEYLKLFYSAKVSRVDLAIDSYSHDLDQLTPYHPNLKTSGRHVDKNGILGTLYLGGRSSALRYRIYDKKKHLKEKKSVVSAWTKFTRFEAMIRRTGLPASALLGALENPFSSLSVVMTEKAKKLYPDDFPWRGFLKRSKIEGSPAALSLESPTARKKYRARLVSLGFKLPNSWPGSLAAALWRIAPKQVMSASEQAA